MTLLDSSTVVAIVVIGIGSVIPLCLGQGGVAGVDRVGEAGALALLGLGMLALRVVRHHVARRERKNALARRVQSWVI
jgi:hypothetical protein